MIATATTLVDDETHATRFSVTPRVEFTVLGIAIAIAVSSYWLITHQNSPEGLIAPPLVALLLVANLVPGVALMMLLGRRIARRRAVSSPIGGGGRIHVRLVAIFSMVAAVPMILVAIFASLLFQYGVQFWYSDKARGMIENATALATSSYNQMLDRWTDETVAMSGDLSTGLTQFPIDSLQFQEYFGRQVYQRSLNEAAIYSISRKNGVQTLALVNPYDRNLSQMATGATFAALRAGRRSVATDTGQRIQVVTRLPGTTDLFLYAGRISNLKGMSAQTERAKAVLADYRGLLAQSRSLQLRFNAALLIVSLIIVGISVWIALAVADRLVRPVGELVEAARRVAGGDLTARVPDPRTKDEVGTLAKAFNQMTGRLQEQNADLVTANDQLDSRRALIEAVMAGVSAGVVATGIDRVIRIANNSATALLGTGAQGVVGRRLREVAPELDDLLDDTQREAIVEINRQGESRTLAVRIARTDTGPILTFDDITQQLLDQRRAAWSDVARRIAHEIKNPLTPIQLAAERLQRRYGGKIDADDGVFARLTDTIIRQVGDLRRMVDEFSSFARMPKPVFRRESIVDIVRQALFLHEVAHPQIRFTLDHDETMPMLVCDRRQLGQAMTNIVKNGVEAIEATGRAGGTLNATIRTGPGRTVSIEVADDGTGLPLERDRIVEPYVTTRARGTGLGLAIVKKIVEEHYGSIGFSDRPGGGTVVAITLDATSLAALDEGEETKGAAVPRGRRGVDLVESDMK